MNNYQQCNKCLIDNNSYKYTSFNAEGVCEYCINFEKNTKKILKHNIKNSQKYNDDLKKKLTQSKKKK